MSPFGLYPPRRISETSTRASFMTVRVVRFTKAGAQGRNSGNVVRDIVRACQREGLMDVASPYEFEAPGPDGTTVRVKVFLPHEFYPTLVMES